MPVAVLSAAESTAAMAKMHPDLALELRRHDTSEMVITQLAQANFCSVRKFQMFGHSEESVEDNCKLLGLDRSKGLGDLSEIVSLKAAWVALKTFQHADDKQRAETKLMGLVTPMRLSEYNAARLSYERAHGDQSEHRLSGQSIIDKIGSDIENEVVCVPRLSELPSKEEQDIANENNPDGHGLSMTVSGQGVRVTQPKTVKPDMPKNTEEFRSRIRFLELALEFIKIRHSTNAHWASSSNTVWPLHTDYVLGPEVMGRQMKDAGGTVRKTPDWEVVMGYEMALRSKAAELMYKGRRPNGDRYCLEHVLDAARKCERTHHVHFNEKFLLHKEKQGTHKGASGNKRGRSPSSSSPPRTKKQKQPKSRKPKGGGRGKGGKDKKQSTDKANNRTLHTKYNNLPICYAFNRTMVHRCQLCVAEGHPYTACTAD